MKNFLFIFIAFVVTSCHSQGNGLVFSSAVRDDSLTIMTTGGMNGGCTYLERPVYYSNADYAVYQDCKTRMVFYPDVATFKTVAFNEYGFALDKNGVYIKGAFVAVDTTGFAFLGANGTMAFWKTNTSVYRNTTALPHLNAAKFKRFTDNPNGTTSAVYFTDGVNLYYFDQKMEGADLQTTHLHYSDNQHIYDKNYLYLNGKIETFEGQPLQYVNNTLNKTATKVIRQGKVITNLDAKTLVGLSRTYAKDKNNVYVETFTDGIQILPIARMDFSALKTWDHTNSAYLSDGKNLFYRDQIFPKNEFDVATFGTFGFTDFCYDKNGVYTRRYDEKLNKVVYDKFPFHYTDAVSAKNVQITGGSSLYVYYKNQAYEESTKTLYKNVTPEQIAITKKSPGISNRVRLTNVNGKAALKETFDYKLYKVNNAVYYDDTKTDADGATFRPLHYDYFADKNNVYVYSREKGLIPINGIDVKTVRVFNGFLMDKNFLYQGCQIIKSDKIELLASYPGYRLGCGLDETPSADFYLFRNVEGFWWVKISNEVTVRFLGTTLDKSISPLFTNLELPK